MKNLAKDYAWTGLEIAVIGMNGRFPGADNLDQFWNNLKNGVESIIPLTDEELKANGVDEELLNNPDYVKAGAFLKDIESFDASFFDYTPEEVQVMDPQTRMFHECVWEALEDAGYDPKQYPGAIGLYASASPNLYWEMLSLLSRNLASEYFSIAIYNDKDFLTTHVSYKLDLHGPSMTLSTACSSSLTAIHLACQSLLGGECQIALAGGITLSLPQKQGYLNHEGSILSPDGHCRAFDADAQGTVFGSGAGVVVLKPLEDALADGDNIHAVIRSSAINNDGHRKVGYTAPSVKGQAMVIKAAQHAAEVDAETISYIETHGTGTPLGDPIEFEALKLAFDTDKKGICRIGTIKPNIGHLYCAAGIAGFIKTILALSHKEIPPSINFKTPNPQLDFENSPFRVNTELSEWTHETAPLRAGVSSFGIGGTNAHIILEEAPIVSRTPHDGSRQIIPLSARTPSALDNITKNLLSFLRSHPQTNLADAAYTLQVGRAAFEYRKMLVCSDIQELLENLSSADSPKVVTSFAGQQQKKMIFMYPGEESQYINMGRELFTRLPMFRENVEQCFAALTAITGQKYTVEHLAQTPATPEALFILEYSLAQLLISWGIVPTAMIGQGIGEYTAACVAGVLSIQEALTLLRAKDSETLPHNISFKEPEIPYISGSIGKSISTDDVVSPTYWKQIFQETAQLSAGLAELFTTPDAIFIEVGPGNNFSRLMKQHAEKKPEHEVIDLLPEQAAHLSEEEYFLNQIGKIWTLGGRIDWRKLHGEHRRYRIALPAYPFERQRFEIPTIDLKAVQMTQLNRDKEPAVN